MPRRSHKNKKYSLEMKIQAVQSYLSGEGSQREICKKFEILDAHKLRDWILWYNGHRKLKKCCSTKGDIYMTKGIKTTQ